MTYIPFFQMFPLYNPMPELRGLLEDAQIVGAELDMEERAIYLELRCCRYVPARLLDQVSAALLSLYDTRRVEIFPHYPPETLPELEPEELRMQFVRQDPRSWAILAGARWQWEGHTLCIHLPANGKKELESCALPVIRYVKDRFGVTIDLAIEAEVELEGQALLDKMEALRREALAHGQSQTPAAPAPGPRKPKQSAPTPSRAPSVPAMETIFGKPFVESPIPIRDVTLDMRTVCVAGRVFATDHKELARNNSVVVNFDITDYTGSIRINRYFRERDKAKGMVIVDKATNGTWVKVLGKPVINRFDNELVLEPLAILPHSAPKRLDTATEKRVELHLHTTMSNMDALTPTDAAVKQAAAWGHPAIAITDHGCAQSFPDAMKAAGKAKVAGSDRPIKVLYGCEGYYVNDVDDRIVVQGTQDWPLNGEFVAFDLETTGLKSREHHIIEVGAVILKDGQEVDRFQSFVSTTQTLTQQIMDLTGITPKMLEGAPHIREVLPRFLEFCGNRPLIAHNADFDVSFVTAACDRLGLPYEPTFVDTLILSQNLLPELGKFKLNLVADALSLPEFRHHRAADDALTCGLVYDRLRKRLEETGISSLSQINPAMPALRSKNKIGDRHARHIILIAKNQTGLRNLYKLISLSNLEHFKRVPRIPKSELLANREGLIIGAACEAGELFQAVIARKSQRELLRIASFYDYLEIQPLDNNRFMIRKGMVPNEETLRDFNRTIVELGRILGKPVCATGDVHFLNPEDEIYRHILLSTKGFEDCDAPNPLYFRTTDEMLREFAYLGEETAYDVVVKWPNYIADLCETLRPVPHNLFAPSIENSVEDLKSLVYGKLHRLYGENPPELMLKRIETELNDIISCHYDVIYMSAQKLVQNSLENGYLVGSRGSVGSSIVAFMSGITEVNSFPPHYRCPNPACKFTTFDVPEGYGCGADLPDAVCPKCGAAFEKDGFNIPFETFLGFGGDKVPDIDLNFSGEYQARAHAYCIEMFGKSHVFRAGTIGTIADKTAYGYVKKYLSERSMSVSKAEESRLSAGCVGVRRSTGQHPGGLVVIPQENEIWDFCPVQWAAEDPKSGIITTHFEYHAMEENLLKLDMLGHDDPTMIRMMEDLTGVDAKTIPLDDKDTMSIFTSSRVLGYENDPILGPTGAVAVPEFNTRFTRGVLLDTMPTKFDFLVRICGYTHGTDVWLGNAKDLIVSKTATVDQTIGARDDIMIYLISCGMPEKRSFKIMESVRKGRGLPDGAEEEMRTAGVPEWYIESCKKIKYLFPKAHAVAYCMMAFRIAWFKVHHPLAFYAAYFYRRSQKGGFDAAIMTRSMEEVKAQIAAIDGNEDATDKDEDLLVTLEVVYEFYLRGFRFAPMNLYESHATRFIIKDGMLLPPFVSVSGLGETAAWDIMEGREGKHFISIEEFSAACPKVSKTHIENLRAAGAFGDLPDTSQVSLF